jgi:hypothetical protein
MGSSTGSDDLFRTARAARLRRERGDLIALAWDFIASAVQQLDQFANVGARRAVLEVFRRTQGAR